jgi:predicted AAA+ superfamily ATPase
MKDCKSLRPFLSGGSPVAARELALEKAIPEYVVELIQDWIFGEIVRSGRNRASLIALFHALYRVAPNPCCQLKLAREANLANNTVAIDYIEQLSDLMVVQSFYNWDPDKKTPRLKKAGKYHFVNCLAALAWHPARIRRVEDLLQLQPTQLGAWYEWVVAQELWRRAVVGVSDEGIYFWQSKQHEIDFVVTNHFYEIKTGKTSPSECQWFSKLFPKDHLIIISSERFETGFCTSITMEDFLLERR